MNNPVSSRSHLKLLVAVCFGGAAVFFCLRSGFFQSAVIARTAERAAVGQLRESRPAVLSSPLPAPLPYRDRIEALLGLEPSQEVNQRLFAEVEEWASRCPLDAIAFLESLRQPRRPRLLEHALAGWLKSDPSAAIHYAFGKARDSAEAREWCLGPVLSVLAESEGIETALHFLADLPLENSVYAPLVEVMAGHIRRDPVGSRPVIEQVPLPEFRTMLYGVRGAMLAATQGWDALQTITRESRSDESFIPALNGVIARLYDKVPTEVLAWLAAQPDDASLDGICGRICHSMVEADPAGAARLSERIQDTAMRSIAAESALNYWYAKDPVAALAWAEERGLDPGLIASVVIHSTKPTSASLLQSLIRSECETDLRVRQRQQFHLLSQWLRVDRAAALGWLRSSSFPPEIKSALEQEWTTSKGSP